MNRAGRNLFDTLTWSRPQTSNFTKLGGPFQGGTAGIRLYRGHLPGTLPSSRAHKRRDTSLSLARSEYRAPRHVPFSMEKRSVANTGRKQTRGSYYSSKTSGKTRTSSPEAATSALHPKPRCCSRLGFVRSDPPAVYADLADRSRARVLPRTSSMRPSSFPIPPNFDKWTDSPC